MSDPATRADHTGTWPDDAGDVLLPLARAAIAEVVGRSAPGPAAPAPAWLDRPGCCFVTLTIDGNLRGCIGSLSPRRPLGADVSANAVAAATDDPRFRPLTGPEFDVMAVEVSVLSPAEPLTFTDEADAVRQLRPGVDGLILERGRHRGTYLPQVWEKVPEPAAFLRDLKRKAGLRADDWGDDMRLSRYTVAAWEEHR